MKYEFLEKIKENLIKVYSLIPLKDSAFKLRCWFFYTLIFFYTFIGSGLIMMTILYGTQMHLKPENKIIFPIVLCCLLIFIFNCWFNNWIVKQPKNDIIKNYKIYVILSIVLVSFWTLFFIKIIQKRVRNINKNSKN